MLRFGIDLGGTKIEGAILDPEGNIFFRERIPTEQEKGYEHILSGISRLYEKMCKAVPGQAHTLGIGTPGALSSRTGFLKNSNTVCLNGRLTLRELEQRLGHPLSIQNDANCFAAAEARFGAGKGYRTVFGVIMGTGCGGGIVIDGQVLTGHQAIAGEWGHMSMDPAGPLCYCGARGCVETLISGGGLEKRYFEMNKIKKPLKEIVSDYRAGNKAAGVFMQEFFHHFGRAMANLINVLDPDIVVLGGGCSNIDELYSAGVRETASCAFNDELKTPIVKNRLGDSAGVLGAALTGV